MPAPAAVPSSRGRFHRTLTKITAALSASGAAAIVIAFIAVAARAEVSPPPPTHTHTHTHTHARDPSRHTAPRTQSSIMDAISVCVVILVAATPLAMEVLCTAAVALGVRNLSDHHATVARISVIEDLASVTVLCWCAAV